jgi:hypothetical protein
MQDTQVQIDSFTIKDFEDRYHIARSNVNNRISGLKQKGYDLEPEKVDGTNVYSAAQAEIMDRLHQHIRAGATIASFPATFAVGRNAPDGNRDSVVGVVPVLQRRNAGCGDRLIENQSKISPEGSLCQFWGMKKRSPRTGTIAWRDGSIP